VEAKKQPGRPCRVIDQIQRALDKKLEKSPRTPGLKRNRLDGEGNICWSGYAQTAMEGSEKLRLVRLSHLACGEEIRHEIKG
jgi:hypothetical protein